MSSALDGSLFARCKRCISTDKPSPSPSPSPSPRPKALMRCRARGRARLFDRGMRLAPGTSVSGAEYRSSTSLPLHAMPIHYGCRFESVGIVGIVWCLVPYSRGTGRYRLCRQRAEIDPSCTRRRQGGVGVVPPCEEPRTVPRRDEERVAACACEVGRQRIACPRDSARVDAYRRGREARISALHRVVVETSRAVPSSKHSSGLDALSLCGSCTATAYSSSPDAPSPRSSHRDGSMRV